MDATTGTTSVPEVNAGQAAAWNGHEGTHWADHHRRYEAVNEGFDEPLLDAAAVVAGDRVLDVGCGTGQTTRAAARRASPGHVVGIDLSAPMLDRAGRIAVTEGVANVSFVRGDAQVHSLPAASFDVALSRFGVMFFDDLVAAFSNIGAAVRPGGRLAFVSMRPLADHDLGRVLAALAAHLPGPDQDDAADAADAADGGPFSLSDPAVVRGVLTTAGFTEITVTPVDASQVWGRDAADATEFLAGWGPIRHALDGLDAAIVARALDAMRDELRRFEESGAVRMRGAGLLVTATRG